MKGKSEKAQQLIKAGNVSKTVETEKRIHFNVIGETEIHSVIFDKEKKKFNCDCRFFALQEKDCSHIIACRLKENL